MPKTSLIIVTYNPDMQQLNKTIQSIINQVSHCIIIDNGNTKFNFNDNNKIKIVNLGKNYGIAYAQNRGIELAKQLNSDFIVLSDQDTVFPLNYIKNCLLAYRNLKNDKIAALAPVCFDINKNAISPIMLTKFKYILNCKKQYIKTEHVISSGLFIPMEVINIIGLMNELLFIDYVDFEWCWRANKLGYKIFTISDLIIHHKLGDDVKKIFGMQITRRSDNRYYYIIRNACYLARYSPYLKNYERLLMFKKVFLHIIVIILIKRNIQCLQIIKSAMLDGLLNKLNKNQA